MKNAIAVALGLVMIVAAMWMAAGSNSRDITPRPEVALGLETALHSSPSATPPPTRTLAPSATPFRLTMTRPSGAEIVRALFQQTYQELYILARTDRIMIQPLENVQGQNSAFVASSDAVVATDGVRQFPGAFAAIYWRENGEYVLQTKQLEIGSENSSVSVQVTTQGELVLISFYHREDQGGQPLVSQNTVAVLSCNGLESSRLPWILPLSKQEQVSWKCIRVTN